MGQLLLTLIVPPIVGVVTYLVVRRIWERDENGAAEAAMRHAFRCGAGGRDNYRCVGNVRSLYPSLHVARTGRALPADHNGEQPAAAPYRADHNDRRCRPMKHRYFDQLW